MLLAYVWVTIMIIMALVMLNCSLTHFHTYDILSFKTVLRHRSHISSLLTESLLCHKMTEATSVDCSVTAEFSSQAIQRIAESVFIVKTLT